jgi:hypothetical protein
MSNAQIMESIYPIEGPDISSDQGYNAQKFGKAQSYALEQWNKTA